MRFFKTVFLHLLAVGGLLFVAIAPVHAQSPIKVMPLGDSITYGYPYGGGYRIELEDKGIPIDFVGSEQNGPPELSDKDHEGWLGWEINGIAGSVVGWLNTYQPEYVLLLIGTNDVNHNADLSQAPTRLSNLIDTIVNTLPNVKVLVGSIPPISNSTSNARAVAYNNAIPGIVSQKQSQGKGVYFVDIYASLTVADLNDGVHPNLTGYGKMANAWFNVLAPIVNGTASPQPSVMPSPGSSPQPSPSGVVSGSLTITAPLSLNTHQIASGSTVTGTVTYTNNTSNTISINNLVIAARPPGGTNEGGPYEDFNPEAGAQTFSPGQSRTFTASRSFTSADPTGNWYVFTTYNDNSGWHDASTHLNQTLVVGVQPGDVDGNGIINIQDLLSIVKDIVFKTTTFATDVDTNGKINVVDFALVAKMLMIPSPQASASSIASIQASPQVSPQPSASTAASPLPSGSLTTANPNANQKVKNILAYFYSLDGRENNKVLSGQFASAKTIEIARQTMQDINNQTGSWPAILGLDYHSEFVLNSGEDLTSTNNYLAEYWNNGGLPIVMVHPINPWNNNFPWDANYRTRGGSLRQIITPGNSAYNNWMTYLDRMAAGFQNLQSRGVVVLWMPFHDMNGSWFWWGGADPNDFKAVWQHMLNYFSNTKGLNNIIWIYSVTDENQEGTVSVDTYYPGDALVDMVGMSRFLSVEDPQTAPFSLTGYQTIIAHGKPFGITEFGPVDWNLYWDWTTQYNWSQLLNTIKTNYPKTVFFQVWEDKNALSWHANAAGLMSDPWVVTRNELPSW